MSSGLGGSLRLRQKSNRNGAIAPLLIGGRNPAQSHSSAQDPTCAHQLKSIIVGLEGTPEDRETPLYRLVFHLWRKIRAAEGPGDE